MQILRHTVPLLLATMVLNHARADDEPVLSAADVQLFESKIRPVLIRHCYEWHSAEAKEVGGKLLLDSRDALLKGDEAGAVLVAGQPGQSLLIQAMRYDGVEMPPEKPVPEAVSNVGSNHLPLAAKRRQLDFVQSLNRKHLDDRHGDDKLDSVIQSMELGFRMQASAPELLDLSDDPAFTWIVG